MKRIKYYFKIKNIKVIIFILIIFCVISAIIFYNNEQKQLVLNEKIVSAEEIKPTEIPCPRDNNFVEASDISDEELMIAVYEDKRIFKFIRDNCQWVFDSMKANLIDQDKENIVIVAAGVGCASCHTQTLFIFSEGNMIFEKFFDDPIVKVIKGNKEPDKLEIVEPLRSADESLSWPTWSIKTVYKWFNNDLFAETRTPIKN